MTRWKVFASKKRTLVHCSVRIDTCAHRLIFPSMRQLNHISQNLTAWQRKRRQRPAHCDLRTILPRRPFLRPVVALAYPLRLWHTFLQQILFKISRNGDCLLGSHIMQAFFK